MTDLLKQIRAEAALPDQAGYEVYSAMGAERENARLIPLIEKLCGVIEALTDTSKPAERFLHWPLPKSVASDLCVTTCNYNFDRSGTSLLTADEAKIMVEYILADARAEARRLLE